MCSLRIKQGHVPDVVFSLSFLHSTCGRGGGTAAWVAHWCQELSHLWGPCFGHPNLWANWLNTREMKMVQGMWSLVRDGSCLFRLRRPGWLRTQQQPSSECLVRGWDKLIIVLTQLTLQLRHSRLKQRRFKPDVRRNCPREMVVEHWGRVCPGNQVSISPGLLLCDFLTKEKTSICQELFRNKAGTTLAQKMDSKRNSSLIQ